MSNRPGVDHQPLQPADLQEYMRRNGIGGELMILPVPTPTVQVAAEAVGAQPEQIVKSILFTIDESPLLAVACGTARIDRRKIGGYFGVGRKRVRLADPEAVLALTGYEVGAMPPFGHRLPVPTLLDPQVLEFELVYAGGGAENALVRLSSQELARAVHPAKGQHRDRGPLVSIQELPGETGTEGLPA